MTHAQALFRTAFAFTAAASLSGCGAIVLNAPGDIAHQQGNLILIATALMLLIIVPVIILTLLFAWRYRASNTQATYRPDWDHSMQLELLIWAAPLLIIIALGAVTWISTHTLDPYRPLARIDASHPIARAVEPLEVDVIALDWKWLFIYPEQGVASVNAMAVPVDRPIRFQITAGNVMNAFYVPALAGMIYAMPGMETSLHAVMNRPGDYEGFSSNFSGAGFSQMRFHLHATDAAGFTQWVAKIRAGGGNLDSAGYLKLAQPSENEPVRYYSAVDADLYHAILNRCIASGQVCIDQMMSMTHAPAMPMPMSGHGAGGRQPPESLPSASGQTAR